MARRTARTKAEQTDETTRALIAIARAHFATHGYAQASTEAIVAEAGVTRGALYHRFGSKEGLFRAVLADVQADVATRVADAAGAEQDPWRQMVVGCEAFLRASLDRDVQQIMLIDGPATIDWDDWRAMDAENAMRLLEQGLGELDDAGVIAVASVESATRLLSGAMNEAALWIARARDQQRAVDVTMSVLAQLLAGLRADGQTTA